MRIAEKLHSYWEKWGTTREHVGKALDFLNQYEYINTNSWNIDQVISGVRVMQEAAGITIDGEVGPETLAKMVESRCGVSDAALMEARSEALKWGSNRLSYSIFRWDNDLSKQEWHAAIKRALASWSKVANLEFRYAGDSNNSANLLFSVGSGRNDNFDGPGGTLAWAYLPQGNSYRGRLICKFDLGETWIIDPRLRGIMLENVACHEIGHLLGLHHSRDSRALMAPYYKKSIMVPQQFDDIPRIQSRYGKPIISPPIDPPAGEELTIKIKGNIESIVIPGYRISKKD